MVNFNDAEVRIVSIGLSIEKVNLAYKKSGIALQIHDGEAVGYIEEK